MIKTCAGLFFSIEKKGSGGYRYGFNGKEQDADIDGTGVDYDYGARIYDARAGRWLSVDPLQTTYPYYSPFIFAANNPTASVDFDGRDIIRFVTTTTFYPAKSSGLDGNVGYLPPYITTNRSVVVIKAPGADQFFVDAVRSELEANGAVKTLSNKSTEFFPNDPNPFFAIFSKSGVTQTNGASIPFVDSDDPDAISLAKLAPPKLVEYLEKHDPKQYGGLSLQQAGMHIQAAVQEFGNAILTLVDGIGLYEELTVSEIPEWKGPVDYSPLDQTDDFAHTRAAGKEFTPSQKAKIKEYNKKMNGGYLRSDIDGSILDESTANPTGKLKNMNQAEVDHIQAKKHRTKPGTNHYSNARVISAKDNLLKSNH